MKYSDLTVSNAPPSVAGFIALRALEGWGELSVVDAQKALSGGLVNFCLYDGGSLVGMGRAIGDGRLFFLLIDIIVVEVARGHGLGHVIVEGLLNAIRDLIGKSCPDLDGNSEAYIGLMSAHGKEGFYEKIGFTRRPTDKFGAGMSLILKLKIES